MALRGRIGAHVAHSRHDPLETTARARAVYRDSFEKAVDPELLLPLDERTRRAEQLRRAHFARLAYLSAVARRARAIRKSTR
jgi:hypothetical protein